MKSVCRLFLRFVLVPMSVLSGCGEAADAALPGSADGEGDAAAIRFAPAESYAAGPFSPSSVYASGQITSADFDRDGDPDLVVNDCEGSGPLLLANQGGGRFAAPIPVMTGEGACVVAAADFNADGFPDLVTGTSGDRVTVLLGEGGFGFRPTGSFVLPSSPVMEFAFADFNGDARLDIAALGNAPGTVTILEGAGDGSFTLAATTTAAPQAAMSLAVGDFNGDGHADLAVGEVEAGSLDRLLPDNVVILLGQGNGRFEIAGRHDVGNSPEDLLSTDLDRDGRLDLVAANANSGGLSLLYGRSDGGFEAERRLQTLPGTPGVQAADFNHDGHLDLAASATGSSRVQLFQGLGGRAFVSAGSFPTTGATAPQGFIADDLDGNGYADLAVPGYLGPIASGFATTRVAVLINASFP